MVVLERHTLVDGGVDLDINIVASLKVAKVSGGGAATFGSKGLFEESAGVRSVAEGVRHVDWASVLGFPLHSPDDSGVRSHKFSTAGPARLGSARLLRLSVVRT